jgi:hypothetical protein
MKRKNQKLLSLTVAIMLALSFAGVFSSCDMVYVADPETEGSGKGNGNAVFLTEAERNNLESTGHFLKLTCMPVNTQVGNVFSVKVANSSSDVGKQNKENPVCIFKETNSFTATVYIPLSYNDNTDFLETGSFYTAFTIHVDAVKKYVVDLADKVLVDYTDGRGAYDVRNIPQASAADIRYLTIFNLPSGFVPQGISEVAVHNMHNPVASCKNYSLVEVFTSDGVTSVKIPLTYENSNSVFTANGSFFVSFELYYDALTHYSVMPEDRVSVHFISGNGFLDIGNMEGKTIPYLTVYGLPANITKKHFSNISVYNLTGSVANCSNNNNITILKNASLSTALIPLSSGGDDYFRDTGVFIVTFTVNIDILTQIVYTRDDRLMLDFFNGNASFDLDRLGFFNAELTNPSDLLAPVIKKDSSFEISGFIYKADNDLAINSFMPASSCTVYIYAYRNENEIFFEYSPAPPVYNNSKKGYYDGNKRALWKMFVCTVPPSVLGGSPRQIFLAKTPIDDGWDHLSYFTFDDPYLIAAFSDSDPVFALSGDSNPPPQTVILEPGVYLVRLVGAGGGSCIPYTYLSLDNYLVIFITGDLLQYGEPHHTRVLNISNNGNLQYDFFPNSFYKNLFYFPLIENCQGGDGGIVTELLFLNSSTTFTAFTGSGGDGSEVPSSGFSSGGAGGGSGSFLFSEQGYLLCAGGGAGSPGVSSFAPGGGGGIGGSIGSGSGGGASGLVIESLFFQDTYANSTSQAPYFTNESSSLTNYISSYGGKGGGYNGGSGGVSSGGSEPQLRNGSNGVSFVPVNSNLYDNNFNVSPYDYIKLNKTDILTHSGYSAAGSFSHLLASRLTTASYQTFSSGSGGSAFYISYSPVFNTLNANGIPERPPALPADVSMSNGRSSFSFYSLYNFSYANRTNQRNGGNNRTSIRGGGGNGGSKPLTDNSNFFIDRISFTDPKGKEGSVAIYKIQ